MEGCISKDLVIALKGLKKHFNTVKSMSSSIEMPYLDQNGKWMIES